MTGRSHPRSARWVALEQAEYHRLREVLDRLGVPPDRLGQALDALVVYGEACAQRASELARAAAEVRARRRIAAALVEA